MARKVFQHFAHVLRQRFVEAPSSRGDSDTVDTVTVY